MLESSANNYVQIPYPRLALGPGSVMGNYQEGVIALRGKSHQVFAYFSPDGPAYFVDQPSTYYLPRLRLLRNLIIQFISGGETDRVKFVNLLNELKYDHAICLALPKEIRSTVSLPQLLIVLRERHQTQENMCSWVASAFGKLISELESGRINYYNDSDWEIRPPPGREEETIKLTNVDSDRVQSRQSSKLLNKNPDSVEKTHQLQKLNIQLPISTSWPFFSIVCGIGAVIFTIVLWWIPSAYWKAIIFSLTGVGVIVAITVQSLNPVNFYRRWLSYVIPGGIFVNVLGFTFDAFFTSGNSSGSFQWNGTASGLFFISWAIVVLGLVWGDSQQKR